MLYGLAYQLAMFCANADESTALTKACSLSERWLVGRKVIANEMRQEKKIIIFLDYTIQRRTNTSTRSMDAMVLSKCQDNKLLSQFALDMVFI